MKHVGLFCLKCGTIIFSRAQHDYRNCKCKNVAIDGGFDHHFGFNVNSQQYLVLEINLPNNLTKAILYNDWNNRNDKFGFYPAKKWPPFIKKAKVIL